MIFYAQTNDLPCQWKKVFKKKKKLTDTISKLINNRPVAKEQSPLNNKDD